MPQDNDLDLFDDEGPEEESSGLDLDAENVRIFSIDDEEDDLDLETVESIPEKPELSTVLANLRNGERIYADLHGFSDLSAADLTLLKEQWPLITPELRASVVRESFDISQEEFTFLLARFFLFASHDSETDVRQLAVIALGFEEEPAVATRLLEVLESDESDDVRSEAAKSLGPIATLASWLEYSPELMQQIADCLYAVAENDDESWHVRRRAAESVAAFGPNDRVNRIVQTMYDEEEMGLRASALFAAGRGNQRAWLRVAIEEFENEDSEIRFEAARSTGMFGDVEALPGLSELAKDDEDVDVRHAAITAIGEIGGPGATRILTRLYDDAPESDHDVIDDALIEASLDADPFSFGMDSAHLN